MNPVAEEILMHYGIKRRSGRYPYGSGEDPYQHGRDLLGRIEELKKEGWTETPENIKKEFGLTTTQYRTEKALAKNDRRMLQVETAKRLRDKEGLGATEIGRKMGLPESTVRSLLDDKSESNMKRARATADFLKRQVDEKGMIDVGTSTELELSAEFGLNISKETLKQALYILEKDGYPTYKGGIPQPTNPGQQTNQMVLCPPGTEHKEIYNFDQVHTIRDYISRDGGETYEKKFTYPESMDSSRIQIRYSEDGGVEKDGIVELRRGVADLSLGESRYSQVRILVDGTHYIKGMAVYSDAKDWPDGVDLIFNTNKTKNVAKMDVLKEIKKDPDNPFGSAIKDADQGGQYWYDPETGKRCKSTDPGAKLGLINKRSDEGDWSDWKDALPSQFLGKQNINMARKQLELARADKQAEFDEIMSLNNPTIKKHYLNKFAESCDSAAVHLQAAALPGQKYHVIIPVNSLKETEVYAPGYENGSKLALIRYPHAGTFEIPIVTVNNKNATAKKLIGTDAGDAICINHKVAERLSGADFDGDTVMCIPTHDKMGKVKITSTDELKGLKGFDPKTTYGADKIDIDEDGTKHYYRNGKEYRIMKNTGTQMGIVSNLITDMTLADATPEELARAVKHSMVVIDAEKHKLDYKQSEIDNGIDILKKKYQTGGASTILSRAKGEVSIDKRQGSPKVNMEYNPRTGEKNPDYDPTKPEGALIFKTADDLYYPDRTYDKATKTVTLKTVDGKKISYSMDDKEAVNRYSPVKKVNDITGEVTYTDKSGDISYRVNTRKQQSTRMAETDDAYTLISEAKHPMEILYADHANAMKAMANQARKEMVTAGKIKYDASAKKVYQKEVDALNARLNTALLNASRERAALRAANIDIQNKKQAYEEEHGTEMKKKDVKKISQQAVSKYREEVGSVSRRDRAIIISDREWEAIQAGAVSENTLTKILANTDVDSLRERAMPRATSTLSPAKINQIKSMNASNYTLEQMATKLGVSRSTITKYLKEAK